MIYFLQSTEGGPVKIGFTDDLDYRRKQLEAHYGCLLALLATRPGGRKEEAEIHDRFQQIRLGRTEQFRPTADLMAFIGRPLLVSSNPDAVETMPGLVAQMSIINLKGTEEFAAWFKGLAAFVSLPATNTIDLALKQFAENAGYKPPMPRRQKK